MDDFETARHQSRKGSIHSFWPPHSIDQGRFIHIRTRLTVFLIFFAAFTGCSSLLGAPASALAFSPDSKLLVWGSRDALIVASGEDYNQRQRLPLPLPRVSSLAFHPHGQTIFLAGGSPGVSGKLVSLDLWSKKVTELRNIKGDQATAVALSSDGEFGAVGSANSKLILFSVERGEITKAIELAGHSGPVLSCAFSPDGAMLVSASADRSLKAWSVPEGNLLRSFSHHTEIVHSVAMRPRKEGPVECASVSDDQTLRVWQPAIGRMVRIVRNHDGSIFALAYSPDGSFIYTAGREGIIRQVDASSDEILKQLQGHEEAIYSLAVSPDGRTLASGDWTGKVKIQTLPGRKSK